MIMCNIDNSGGYLQRKRSVKTIHFESGIFTYNVHLIEVAK